MRTAPTHERRSASFSHCTTQQMVNRHLLTFEQFPSRAEPLHALALYQQRKKRHHLAYYLAEIGRSVPFPEEALFVEAQVYEWKLEDIVAVSLFWIGRKTEAATLNRRLLAVVPESERARIAANLAFCKS